MPIVARECEVTTLNLFRFSGRIGEADLETILDFHAARRGAAAGRDEVLVFEAGADLSPLTPAALLHFKTRLGSILRHVRPAMIVRTALVCREPACLPVLKVWTGMSTPDDGFHTEVRVQPTVETAAAWIGLDPDAAATVTRELAPHLPA